MPAGMVICRGYADFLFLIATLLNNKNFLPALIGTGRFQIFLALAHFLTYVTISDMNSF